ncbi:hypothetical protein EJ065_3144 [Corallococcus coralloides]|uniref:Uncharacterized protein n=1 Tax=Corallococcus coralloides TaxID=184914 RepID=A0A410RSB7_CORCK|nr:hypothetical protein [Corallococcus coralloides]QAT84711.1 hypothetical protein EJ065_3144 [Corallococcus coralloides]
MSAVTRLSMELDGWQAAWKQLEAFLDRMDGVADQDAPHVQTVCALLPVFNVIERARSRAVGVALAPALAAAPRGEGLPAVSVGSLVGSESRLPGVEELEFAVGTIGADGDGKLTGAALLAGTVTLFAFRDEKHGGEVAVRVPTYDFGPLAASGTVEDAIDAGLFTTDQRKDAAESGVAELGTWTGLRTTRRAELQTTSETVSLSSVLDGLSVSSASSAFDPVASGATARQGECLADRNVLLQAKATLEEQGAAPELTDALQRAADSLQASATDYGAVATALQPPRTVIASVSGLASLKTTLRRADSPGIPGQLSNELTTLDIEAGKGMDEAVASRLAYPDGSLRMLRTLEWSLRFHWVFRQRWFDVRNRAALAPLLTLVLKPFCDSLTRVLAGQSTGIPLVGPVALVKDTLTQATALSVTPTVDLGQVQPGHVAHVGGDRPTLALVLGWEVKGAEKRLRIAPLNVSIATDAKLPGVAGLVRSGTPVDGSAVSVSSQELMDGHAATGPQADGVVQEIIALGAKLNLILGQGGGALGLVPPAVAAPYPGQTFKLLPPVEVGATRLFLDGIPLASTSGSSKPVQVARPGELLLVRGADDEGTWWQGVATVDTVDVRTGAAARADDEVTTAPTPLGCGDDEEVVVITLRDLQMPKALVRDVTLRRDFKGFGGPSLATGVMLPIELDSGTANVTVQDGGVTKTVLRDPELRAATTVLKSWLGVPT